MGDVVGTWQIHIESQDGNEFEPTMKISKDGDKISGSLDYDFGGNTGQSELTARRKQVRPRSDPNVPSAVPE